MKVTIFNNEISHTKLELNSLSNRIIGSPITIVSYIYITQFFLDSRDSILKNYFHLKIVDTSIASGNSLAIGISFTTC